MSKPVLAMPLARVVVRNWRTGAAPDLGNVDISPAFFEFACRAGRLFDIVFYDDTAYACGEGMDMQVAIFCARELWRDKTKTRLPDWNIVVTDIFPECNIYLDASYVDAAHGYPTVDELIAFVPVLPLPGGGAALAKIVKVQSVLAVVPKDAPGVVRCPVCRGIMVTAVHDDFAGKVYYCEECFEKEV